jgi:Undecaprenyl-phosphate glucose phosphotransferase
MTATETQGVSPATRRLPALNRGARSLAYMVAFDLLLINVAFVLGYFVRYQLQLLRPVFDANQAPYAAYIPFQILYTLLLLFFLMLDGVYQRRRRGSWLDELYRLLNATTTAVIILVAVTFIFQPLVYSRLLLIEVTLITIVLLGGARLVQRAVQASLRRRGLGVARVLIIGAGATGRAVMRNLVALPELGYQVVGFVDDDVNKGDLGRFRALGTLDSLGAVLKTERVDEVIITLPWAHHRTIIALVRACEQLGVLARVVPDLFQLSLTRVDFDDLGGIPLMGLREARIPRTGRLIKRALDFTLAALGLLLSAPLIGLVALLIKLDSPGPVFYVQERMGLDGKPFPMFKFRSMRRDADLGGPGWTVKDDPRRTRLGAFIRKLSIDELPNFINVLLGDMSLVGPRPEQPAFVQQFRQMIPRYMDRHFEKAGITGWAQVNGLRGDTSIYERTKYDLWYIENWSVWLDIKIIIRTIFRVFSDRNAY